MLHPSGLREIARNRFMIVLRFGPVIDLPCGAIFLNRSQNLTTQNLSKQEQIYKFWNHLKTASTRALAKKIHIILYVSLLYIVFYHRRLLLSVLIRSAMEAVFQTTTSLTRTFTRRSSMLHIPDRHVHNSLLQQLHFPYHEVFFFFFLSNKMVWQTREWSKRMLQLL